MKAVKFIGTVLLLLLLVSIMQTIIEIEGGFVLLCLLLLLFLTSFPKSKILKDLILGVLFLWLLLLPAFLFIQRELEDSIIKQLQIGSNEMLGHELDIKTISYKLFTGHLTLREIQVKNPVGYSDQCPVITVGKVCCQFSPFALLLHPIHIRRLSISNMMINLEAKKTPKDMLDIALFFMSSENNLFTLKTRQKKSDSAIPEIQYSTEKSVVPCCIQVDDFSISATTVRLINLNKILETELLKTPIPKLKKIIKEGQHLQIYTEKNLGYSENLTVSGIIQKIYSHQSSEIKKEFYLITKQLHKLRELKHAQKIN